MQHLLRGSGYRVLGSENAGDRAPPSLRECRGAVVNFVRTAVPPEEGTMGEPRGSLLSPPPSGAQGTEAGLWKSPHSHNPGLPNKWFQPLPIALSPSRGVSWPGHCRIPHEPDFSVTVVFIYLFTYFRANFS